MERNHQTFISRWFLNDHHHLSMDFYFQSHRPTSRSWRSDSSLKNFRQISPAVQTHLKLVYLTLCSALVACAAGAYLHILWNLGGFLTAAGCAGSVAWLLASPVYRERKRFLLLMAASVMEGASVGPLVQRVIDFDPRILVIAFVGTALAFGCFSGAAVVAKRREFLYLGGLLSSGFSFLFWLHFASNIFGPSVAVFKAELYFGLLMFLGYMVFDTQQIIERAHRGDLDYVKHALTLFTDFIAVLVRIVIIMFKNASDRSKKEEKRKKRY